MPDRRRVEVSPRIHWVLWLLLAVMAVPSGAWAQADARALPEATINRLDSGERPLSPELLGHPTLLVLSFQRDQLEDLKSWMQVDAAICP